MLKSQDKEWRGIKITKSTSEVRTLFDLIGERGFGKDFDLKIEKVMLSETPGLSMEMFGLERPDVVLWSKKSGQNRIVIEVKQATKATHKEDDASQFLRYFLHLLVTTDRKPKRKEDIGRGVFAAAPGSWFENRALSSTWYHLVERYGPLAKTFEITLGEIRAEDL
ncbi:MAG: hypothetical protein ACRD2L_00880 [Terriglobia bacterium]